MAKFTPRPSQVAPNGYERPGQTRILLVPSADEMVFTLESITVAMSNTLQANHCITARAKLRGAQPNSPLLSVCATESKDGYTSLTGQDAASIEQSVPKRIDPRQQEAAHQRASVASGARRPATSGIAAGSLNVVVPRNRSRSDSPHAPPRPLIDTSPAHFYGCLPTRVLRRAASFEARILLCGSAHS